MKLFLNRWFWLGNFLLTAALIGLSFWLENYKGIQPCPLCMLQRFIFIGLAITFLAGSLFTIKYWQIFIGILTSLFSSIGIIFAGRQVWLQLLPPANQPADCAMSLSSLFKLLPPGKVMSQIFQGSVECGRVSWDFLNFSLAEWSLMFFLLFFILSITHTVLISRNFADVSKTID